MELVMNRLKSSLRSRLQRFLKIDDNAQKVQIAAASNKVIDLLRAEYTVMPRFQFHQPLDYNAETWPPTFNEPLKLDGVELLVPTGEDRFGYAENDTKKYLDWGKYDHDLIKGYIDLYSKTNSKPEDFSILDFGCSSGRVLRHFQQEHKDLGWKLNGVDIQARAIEWMRNVFPQNMNIYTGSTLPHLPFEDNSLDAIYGISVFTHVKYLWDAWLLELRRVLKPGGLLMQTIHTENAWRYYHENRKEDWVIKNHSKIMTETAEMNHDFFYFGDVSVSQVFWKREIARKFWGRYVEVVDIIDPPKYSFQDWMICRKAI